MGHSTLDCLFTGTFIGVCIPGVLAYYKEQLSIQPKLSITDNRADEKSRDEKPLVELAEQKPSSEIQQEGREKFKQSSAGKLTIYHKKGVSSEMVEPLLGSSNNDLATIF